MKLAIWILGGANQVGLLASAMALLAQGDHTQVLMWAAGCFAATTSLFGGWGLLMIVKLMGSVAVTDARVIALQNNLDEKFKGAISAHGRIDLLVKSLGKHKADENAHSHIFKSHAETLRRHDEQIKVIKQRIEDMKGNV